MEEKKEEKKVEKKLKGDYVYNCTYCNIQNHLARDCMLRNKRRRRIK